MRRWLLDRLNGIIDAVLWLIVLSQLDRIVAAVGWFLRESGPVLAEYPQAAFALPAAVLLTAALVSPPYKKILQ